MQKLQSLVLVKKAAVAAQVLAKAALATAVGSMGAEVPFCVKTLGAAQVWVAAWMGLTWRSICEVFAVRTNAEEEESLKAFEDGIVVWYVLLIDAWYDFSNPDYHRALISLKVSLSSCINPAIGRAINRTHHHP